MKPATPAYCHSQGSPQTYTLRDGRTVELRNGCVVDEESRHTLAGSRQATEYLLTFGKLTQEQREHLEEWGVAVCDRMSSQESFGMAGSGLRRSNRVVERMGAA